MRVFAGADDNGVELTRLIVELAKVSEAPRLGMRFSRAPQIFGVHISDWRTPHAFGDRVLPGMGEIPIVRLLRVIRKTGYRGAYALEIFSNPRLPDSLWKNPRRTAAAGQKAFEQIWRQVCA